MKVQFLPSSFDADGKMSQRQHLTCVVVDDCVAFDAGSLAFSCSDYQRENIRDIVISHVHLDHIAGLPLFLDDLFSTLTEPVRVHATSEMIAILERDIFNWAIYPKFSELINSSGPIIRYEAFETGRSFELKHLMVNPIAVNHNVPSVGFLISNDKISIGITGDTAGTDEIWNFFNRRSDLAAIFVECAFPDEMADLAAVSHHMTPKLVAAELKKLTNRDLPKFIVNIKPMYREQVIRQIGKLDINNLQILEIGRVYEF